MFAAFWLAAGVAVAFEWLAMTGVRPAAPIKAIAAGGLAGLVVGWLVSSPPIAALAAGAAIVAATLVARAVADRLWTLAGFAYAAAVALVPIIVRNDPASGLVGILWMFAVVWSTDIAAYFVGRALGGPRLWPAVSPKKTWSGFVGGLAVGTAAGIGVAASSGLMGVSSLGLIAVGGASALASVASQGGDLFESAMKRRFGVKDSGRLIPGHGGVMDRLDGFAAVAILLGVTLVGAGLSGRPTPA